MFNKNIIKSTYSSDEDNILKDFYIPNLSQSVTYDRAVGFFSASMLTFSAQGINSFIKNNGKMRLIACCKCYSPIKHPATPKGAVWGLCNKHRKDETLKIVTAKS